MRLLIRFGLMVAAVWLTFTVVAGLSYDGNWVTLVVVALLIALANALVIPLIKLVSLPIRMMTLGLFTLAINVLVLAGVIALAQNIEVGVQSDGFGSSLLGALLITVLSSVISWFVRD
jgi:putative membrane protein